MYSIAANIEEVDEIKLIRSTSAHRLDFGYLHDAGTKRPLRSFGRHATRITAEFPRSIFAAASPGRVMSNVKAAAWVHDVALDRDSALIFTPVYKPTNRHEFKGAYICVLSMSPELDLLAESIAEGDGICSTALVFDWENYGMHAPRLVNALDTLRPEPIIETKKADERLSAPKSLIKSEKIHHTQSDLTNLIIGAIATGQRIHIGGEWEGSSRAAIHAFCEALAQFPTTIRGHISASFGLTRPDEAIQIAWSPSLEGIEPSSFEALELVEIGREHQQSDFDTFSDTVTCSKFEPRNNDFLSAFGSNEALSLAWRQTVRHSSGQPPKEIMPFEQFKLQPAEAPFDRDPTLSYALTLLLTQERYEYQSPELKSLLARAEQIFLNWLEGRVCLSLEELSTIVGNHGARAVIARHLGCGHTRLTTLIKRSLVAIRYSGETTEAKWRALAGAVMPLCNRAEYEWAGFWKDFTCIDSTLRALAEGRGTMSMEAAQNLGRAAQATGHWHLLRDCMIGLLRKVDPINGQCDEASILSAMFGALQTNSNQLNASAKAFENVAFLNRKLRCAEKIA